MLARFKHAFNLVLYRLRNVVPFVPTPRKIILKMVALAKIKKGERVCDLGSGTGKIIIAVGRRYKDNSVVGIEKSRLLRAVTKLKLLFLHPFSCKRIKVANKDFFKSELGEFDVIFCFLTPEGLRRLRPKFSALKAGSRIISNTFYLEDKTGFDEKIHHPTAGDTIYVYTKS
jgi:precorrin-6B methylase 2